MRADSIDCAEACVRQSVLCGGAGCQSGAAEAIAPLDDRTILRSITKFYGLADATLQESLVYRGASASPKKLYSVSHGARQVLLAAPIDAKRPLRCAPEPHRTGRMRIASARGHGVCVCVCVQRRGTWASGIRETGGALAVHRSRGLGVLGRAGVVVDGQRWSCIGRTDASLPRALTSGATATGRVRYDARTCAQVKSGSDERSCAYRLTQEAASLVAPIGTKQVTPLHMRQYTRARTPVRTASLCAAACCRGYHGSLASPRSHCPHAMCSVAQLIHPTVAELGALLHKQQDAATGASAFSDSATLAELRACALGCVLLLPRLDGADANLAVRQPPAVPDRHISRWPSRHALADRAHAPCRTGGVRRGNPTVRESVHSATRDGCHTVAKSREPRGQKPARPAVLRLWRRFRWFGLMRLVTGWRRAGLRSRDGARQT